MNFQGLFSSKERMRCSPPSNSPSSTTISISVHGNSSFKRMWMSSIRQTPSNSPDSVRNFNVPRRLKYYINLLYITHRFSLQSIHTRCLRYAGSRLAGLLRHAALVLQHFPDALHYSVVPGEGNALSSSHLTAGRVAQRFQLYFDTFQVLTPSSGFLDFAISMRPNYHQAIIDTIRFYGWKKITYLYDSHDGLLRLQQIYQSLKPDESFQVENVKRIVNSSDAIAFLRVLEDQSRWSNKYLVLDCSTEMAKQIVVSHVRDVTLGRRTYFYLLSGLVRFFIHSHTVSLNNFHEIPPLRSWTIAGRLKSSSMEPLTSLASA